MSSRRRFVAGGLAVSTLATATLASPVDAAGGGAKTLLRDLSSPKGIAIGADGAVIVAQGAFGAPGPVLRYDPTGPPRDRTTEITEPFALTDVAISPLDGTGWALSGPFLFQQLNDGTVVEVLDLAAYQGTDPDPVDQEEFPEETNPYGLTVLPNGDALVADAAGNDIVRVTPEGEATTIARFDVEAVSTDQVPPDFPLPPGVELPPVLDAEAVPTTVTVGPDGAIYVGELKGFPFRTGSSKVWRIEPDAEGAWCSVNDPSDDCSVYQDDLTAIQDIDFNERRNRLYVLELAGDGVLAFEEGFATGMFPPAVLLEVQKIGTPKERRVELGKGRISQPGGVAIGLDDKVYVTDGVFTGGRLLSITN